MNEHVCSSTSNSGCALCDRCRGELAHIRRPVAAIFATMFVTYLCLANARKLTERIGPMGIDAGTRIVGFFVSAIGVGLIFDGVIEALEMHGVDLVT
jgi:multiple antibiotic resistance protein